MSNTNDIEKDLNAELEKDLPGARLRHTPFAKPAPVMPHTNDLQRTPRQQLDNFMASTQRMLETQRRHVMEAETAYQIGRIKLLDSYRVRMEDLKHEASEALRAFDRQHDEDTADAQGLLDRLNAMRSD